MLSTKVKVGIAATGLTMVAIGGLAGPAGAAVTGVLAGKPTVAQSSDEEIARYLAENPPIKASVGQVKPVGKGLDIDPATGCLTREAAATFKPVNDETAVRSGGADLPNCWDLVNYLRKHPVK